MRCSWLSYLFYASTVKLISCWLSEVFRTKFQRIIAGKQLNTESIYQQGHDFGSSRTFRKSSVRKVVNLIQSPGLKCFALPIDLLLLFFLLYTVVWGFYFSPTCFNCSIPLVFTQGQIVQAVMHTGWEFIFFFYLLFLHMFFRVNVTWMQLIF